MKEIDFEIKLPSLPAFVKTGELKRGLASLVWLVFTGYIGTTYLFEFLEIIILAYFGLAIIWQLSSRVSAGFALFFLVCDPILLYLKNDELAETFAVYAFYFLVITVFQEILWLKKEQKTTPEPPVDNSSGHPKRKIV